MNKLGTPDIIWWTEVWIPLSDAWRNVVKERVEKVFIPYGTLEQLQGSSLFMWFLQENMKKLQNEGKHGFMDALMEVAKRWNNDWPAQRTGFRLTNNIAPIKSYRVSGRLVRVENDVHLKKVLGINDYKTEHICRALGLSVRDLWPEIILGHNKTSERQAWESDYKKWWESHGKGEFTRLKQEWYGDRDTLQQALKTYNDTQALESSKLQMKDIYAIFTRLFKSELSLQKTKESRIDRLDLASINRELGIRIMRKYLIEKEEKIFLNSTGLEYFATKKGSKKLIEKFQQWLQAQEI